MRIIASIALLLAIALPAAGQEPARQGTMYKSPECTCCEGHANYLKRNGIQLKVIETPDLAGMKQTHGIAPEFEGCHTILLDGYVIEGHVPIGPIRKLLSERPAIKGISLPGMPLGSPGMSGPKERPFVIYEIGSGAKKVFAVE
jgi:hypothetical protein